MQKQVQIKNFIFLLITLLLSRCYDAITTYLYIPNLESELNPIVSIFNLGWATLLTVQVLVLSCLIYTLYLYCFKTVETIKFDEKTTLKEFISIFHFNTANDFLKLLYKLPTNKGSLLYSLGAIIPKGLIIISLIVGSSTTMLILNKNYEDFYRKYHIPQLIIIISAIIMIVFAIDFYKKERKERLLKMN